MKYAVIVDDASPMIKYSGPWSSFDRGPDATLYSGETYHSTRTNTSLASFNFTGTAISIFGSKGPDHSKFIVSLDGSEEVLDGFNSSNVYQTSLFSKDGLAFGKHTITIRNTVVQTAMPLLYLDYIEFETGLDDTIANAEFNVDDSNSTMVYSPPDAWNFVQGAPQYYDRTYHTSNTPSSTVSIYFEGNAVYIFGTIGPDYGTVSVTIDGNATTSLNCSYPTLRPQTLLFYSNDFGSGRHSLVTTISNNSTQRFDFDYLTVSRWSDNNGLGSGKALTPIIAGSVCAAIILLAWFTYLGHWCYLRHQKRKNVTPEMLRASDAMALREEKKKDSQGTTGNGAVTPNSPNLKTKEESA